MFRYFVRRLLQMVLTFFGATFIVYALVFANQDDPLQALAGERPITPSVTTSAASARRQPRDFLTGRASLGICLPFLAVGSDAIRNETGSFRVGLQQVGGAIQRSAATSSSRTGLNSLPQELRTNVATAATSRSARDQL